MKKILSILFSLIFLISSCKKKVLKKENTSTASKNIVVVLEKEFVIKGLNSVSHKIWLYLPPNYETSTEKFPVIYMHDGQNLFDKKTSYAGEWEVDETLNQLFKETGKGFIVVGVENGGEKRIEEYTPYPHEKYGGGKGEIYVDFLANELKPYIDSNYRTKINGENTAIIGSSLGGLISFYGGLKYPNVFGKIGALSTSFWFSNKINDFANKNGNQKNTKLYFLVGGKEGDSMVPDTENMAKLLIDVGFPANNIKTKIVTEGKHNEAFWKTEFLEVITFLYNL
ncbi:MULTISPECIES: alpha/beta hydrolase [unclassified Polaribacter]|uniref:alpha/beta hydrolase n=1 Tax=unclassified Polaribacter TaxID=196858 RepID=UPI0011BD5995|nr:MULTISPECIES: alpha/beta hydrolase-fold protein [unclassified Polaribacter]TXD52784.1 alpha/beta hydrolase [Polaribacter sp. IC063]TXD61661.1 alpha/beta hydrolase [Polaribacter sp. IC066]